MPVKKIKDSSLQRKFHVRTGDKVIVRSGDNRGKTGTVIQVLRDRNRVVVEGDAAVYHTKHVKPDPQNNVEGGRIQRPRPIHISNVALIDPTTGKATRVRHVRDDQGRMVRVAIASGHRFE